jgi:hypothetical protein
MSVLSNRVGVNRKATLMNMELLSKQLGQPLALEGSFSLSGAALFRREIDNNLRHVI